MPDLSDSVLTSRGAWISMGDVATTRRIAGAGFDWICLDQQHGLLDRARVGEILRDLDGSGPAVAVRVTSVDAASIGFALDAGATIVIVPLVDSANDARLAVDAAFYPPLGRRSWGPIEPLWLREAPSAADAHLRTRVWAMIETAGGLDRLDEILSVERIDGVFVGPYDLALALGTTLDELLAADSPDAPLSRIVSACRRAGIAAGAFAGSPARAARLSELGFQNVAVTTDAAIIDAGAAAALSSAAPSRGGY